jgi:tudor domain-containing protein 3
MLTCLFKLMQVVSVRDIYSSSVDASFKNPQQRRLLRFGLTDGVSEAVAIEFSPIPFITEEIAPGTKVSAPYSVSRFSLCSGNFCWSCFILVAIGNSHCTDFKRVYVLS